MSLCIRTISNKFTNFVGTRKPITQFDRQLPKHLKDTSAFLNEFLATGVTINCQLPERLARSNTLIKPLKTSENIVAWNYKLKREGNWNISKNKKYSIKDVSRKFTNEFCTRVSSNEVLSIGEENRALQSEEKTIKQPEESSDEGQNRPSQEQLMEVHKILSSDLPHFFVRSLNYSIYDPMIEFENHIKGTVTKGIYEYVKQASMLRIIGHVKFAYVKFEVLKMTIHPEDDSIKVRWRIKGITGSKIIFKFWATKLWKLQNSINALDSWYDGFSTFYVNGEGKVVKHVADKMMPDPDHKLLTKDKTDITAKLALFLGLLTPREFLADISPLMFKIIKFKSFKEC